MQEERLTGVGRLAWEVTSRLHEQFPDAPLLAPRNIADKWKGRFPLVQFGRLSGAAWEQIELPLFLRGEKRPLLNLANTCPLLYPHNFTVIHDLIPLTNPEWYSRQARLYFRAILPRAARRSQCLFTVSEATKQELQNFLQIPAERIVVTPSCPSSEWRADSGAPKYAPPYLLAVSALDPRKNFRRLIEAFWKIHFPDLKLIIVGAAHKSFSEFLGGNCDLSNVIFTGFLPDEELRRLYTHAEAFVFPSLKEGFGLPPLEAMRCGCPVITSDLPVFKEVCGEAALFVDPESVESIQKGIETLLQNRLLRAELIAKGKERPLAFSWDKTVGIISQKLTQKLP